MCDLFTCGCERACHAVESDSPNGLVTPRISDLETISCIIHSIRDTHLCARQSVRTSAPRFFGPSDLECPPPPLFSAHLSVHVINSHWVMDDLRMQEWGGILPERPILICFLHFSLYLCLDALRAASALRSFSPAAVCRFLSLENMSSDKATKTACVK